MMVTNQGLFLLPAAGLATAACEDAGPLETHWLEGNLVYHAFALLWEDKGKSPNLGWSLSFATSTNNSASLAGHPEGCL